MNPLNQRLVKFRKLADLNQTDVAEKLNIKCSTFSQMERSGTVSAERFFKLAKIYGVSPCQIFYGEEPCKKDIIPQPAVAEIPAPIELHQPAPVKPKEQFFVVTKKEENLLKIIRNFSKPDYNRVIEFIDSIYKEQRK